MLADIIRKNPQINNMEIFSKAFNRPKNRLSKTKKSIFNALFFGETKLKDNEKLFQLATTSYLHNDVNNALKTINSCLEAGSSEKWQYFAFKANCLEDLKEFKKAIENYEIAVELNENDEDVYALYHQIGYCYLNLKNDEKAKEFYTYALQLKNNLQSKNKEDLEGLDGGVLLGVSFQRIYNNRGNALKNLGDFNNAIIDCEKAISIDKNYSNPYLLLSQIYTQTGNNEKSLEYLKVSARLGNNFAKKKLEEIGVNQTSINSNSTGNIRFELEQCLKATFEQHDFHRGKLLAEELINKGVQDIIPYLCLSALYATRENWNLCEKYSLEGLKFDNNNAMLLNHIGVAMCELGKSDGLKYLEYGKNIGDANCAGNYNYWRNRI